MVNAVGFAAVVRGTFLEVIQSPVQSNCTTQRSPLRRFKTRLEIIRLAVMLFICFPLSLRNVEDLLHDRGIESSHETMSYWWNRFGPTCAVRVLRKRVNAIQGNDIWTAFAASMG